MNIQVLLSAERDLEIGSDFYEAQSAGLGDYFMSSLISDIESLKLHGGIHSMEFGFHRARSKRFPFAIYYRVESDWVRVYAVLDCRQNPATRTKRLTDEHRD
jgi:hypothetical protein